ncbi:MAG: family 16 glycoside hydrolase, partial [Gemmatimonadales bacterium]
MTHRAFAGAALFAALLAASPAAAQMNTLTKAEKAHGWRLLFDGKTMADWRGYKMADVPAGWRVADGIIVKDSGAEDIVTRDSFANF